jgi:hypothetical protein
LQQRGGNSFRSRHVLVCQIKARLFGCTCPARTPL